MKTSINHEQIVADEFKNFDLSDPNIIDKAKKIMIDNGYVFDLKGDMFEIELNIYSSLDDYKYQDVLHYETAESLEEAWMKCLEKLKIHYTELF